MSRLETILGVFSAFVFVLFMAIAPAVITIPERAPLEARTASSTIAELTNVTLPPLTLPPLTNKASSTSPIALEASATPVPASTTPIIPPKKTAIAPKAKPIPQTTNTAAVTPAPTPTPFPVSDNSDLNAAAIRVRGALVNIICYVPAGSTLHSISGSGILVDPKGIILTNAHVAQYYLLKDRGVSCQIRTGNPATDRYRARLIYISPAWIQANAKVLTQDAPSGTGENDYALLGIISSANNDPLPAAFPYIPPAIGAPSAGSPVVIASYGAQFLQTSEIQRSLFPTIVFGSVKELYTFVTNTPDVLALGGSAAAQEGSSGGGVASATGLLVGTITTSTVTGTTDTRELNAITLSYIRGAYASATGEALDELLARPVLDSIDRFTPKVPDLEALLTANL